MTARDIIRLAFRRWYFVLIGAALSVGVLSVVRDQPGVYYTQLDVVVLAPRNSLNPNNIEDPHYALSPVAGLLVNDYNGSDRPPILASSGTTLYGEGVREGSRVRLPNNGSQWRPLYALPNIDVQVVADSPERVEREAARIVAELQALLAKRQDELNIDPRVKMVAIPAPQDPVVSYIGGARARSFLAVGLVGAGLTLVIVFHIDRWLGRRRRARATAKEQRQVVTSGA